MKRKAREGVFPRCLLQISTVGSFADVSLWRKQKERKITVSNLIICKPEQKICPPPPPALACSNMWSPKIKRIF